jgi:hypothetical protein
MSQTQGEAMTVTTELFDPQKHYGIICDWWRDQEFPIIPLNHLPQTGVVALFNGRPAAAVWIYKTDSAYCWIGYPVASPEIRKNERSAAIAGMISGAKMAAKLLGFQSAIMSLRNQCLESRIQRQGFQPTDRGVTLYHGDLRR